MNLIMLPQNDPAMQKSCGFCWFCEARQIAFRRLQGAPLATVLNEQAALRDELWMLFTRRLPAACNPAERFALARALDGALQRVLELAILTAADHPGQQAAA